MPGLLQRLQRDARRLLYAAPASASARGTVLAHFAGAGLFLAPALLPLLLGASICALVLTVDPLELRPWGPEPRLSDDNYPELITPKLVRAVTAGHQDVIIMGGSQAIGVTPPQMRAVFGGRRAVNLAYSLVRARDAAAVMQASIRTPGLKRLIVELPFTVMDARQPPAATGAGAISVLTAPWYALPDFGNDIGRASVERLRSGVFALPRWRAQARDFLGTRSVVENPPLHRIIASAFDRVPASRFQRQVRLGCGDFPLIREGIVPTAREAAARGVTLDFYFPPIPAASYPRAETENALVGSRASFIDRLTSFHRCVMLALAPSAGDIHVHATDLDREIVGDLGNYKDTFHLVRPDKFERLLTDLRTRRYEVTAQGADAYEAALRKAVMAAYAARRGTSRQPREQGR